MLSQNNVAKLLGCSVDTVRRNLYDYNIPIHIPSYNAHQQKVILTENQKDYLYGAMLGDGCLHRAKNGLNSQFLYTSKSFQHVDFVSKPFVDVLYKEGIKYSSYFDKRTGKTYDRYTFRTITDVSFENERKTWYSDGIKHIPNNLKLNPTICLIWYIGDGGICNSSKDNGQSVKLATNCFNKKEQESILLPQLKDFDARLCHAGRNKHDKKIQYAIYIPRKHIQDFLDYIGECPFDDYLYKWNVKESSRISYEDYYKDWEKMYLSGNGYTKIAKQYNADYTTVLKYLQKVGVYKNNVGYREYYKEWERRYLNGETYNEISKDYACCSQTILHHLRQVKLYKEKGVIQDGQ